MGLAQASERIDWLRKIGTALSALTFVLALLFFSRSLINGSHWHDKASEMKARWDLYMLLFVCALLLIDEGAERGRRR